MISLEIVSVILAPLISMNYLYKRPNFKQNNWMSAIILIVFSNLITNLGIYIFTQYRVYKFSNMFFIKYCIINCVVSLMVSTILAHISFEVIKYEV